MFRLCNIIMWQYFSNTQQFFNKCITDKISANGDINTNITFLVWAIWLWTKLNEISSDSFGLWTLLSCEKLVPRESKGLLRNLTTLSPRRHLCVKWTGESELCSSSKLSIIEWASSKTSLLSLSTRSIWNCGSFLFFSFLLCLGFFSWEIF